MVGGAESILPPMCACMRPSAGGTGAAAKSLSGGNLQKFIVGREIDANPKLLIVSQPTWGVDVGAAAQILMKTGANQIAHRFSELAQSGVEIATELFVAGREGAGDLGGEVTLRKALELSPNNTEVKRGLAQNLLLALLIGPFGMAAWFGLLVTALNLIPIGQLDGGHVTYALFGSRAEILSRVVWWLCVAMIVLVGPSFILWATLVRVLGLRHPRTLDDEAPLGRGRWLVALLGLAVFVMCFLPDPFRHSWRDFFAAWTG